MAAEPDPNDPATELASFKVAPGFEVNLFASEKDGVEKPIQIRWDTRGRLWVIGSTTYPQIKPGEVPNDKVLILEDTDGDGRADKTTVFADGLEIPTGLEVVDSGFDPASNEPASLAATPDVQPGGLKEISPGFQPGENKPTGARPGGSPEPSAGNSAAPAGAEAILHDKRRVSPGANLPQPSGLPEVDAASAKARVRGASCYVGEGTKLLLLTDTDGDGKADEREVVLRGFGTGDNHQNINSFRWSPGGELMFSPGAARARPGGDAARDREAR